MVNIGLVCPFSECAGNVRRRYHFVDFEMHWPKLHFMLVQILRLELASSVRKNRHTPSMHKIKNLNPSGQPAKHHSYAFHWW